MSTLCKGCNAVVKRSGLYPHFQRSRNPQCELYRCKLDEGALLPDNDSDTAASQAQAHVQVASTERSESETAAITECQSED
jgi:hypothetical protein